MAKYSADTKIAACKDYLEGELTHKEICDKYGITFNASACKSMINEWVPRYLEAGEEAFLDKKGNNTYTAEDKIAVVEEYLSGNGSLTEIAAKYKIPSKETLRKWVLDYQSNKTLKSYNPKGHLYNPESKRKATAMERKTVVKYCIEHNHDYKGTAEAFNLFYGQVYDWVKRYDGSPKRNSNSEKKRES